MKTSFILFIATGAYSGRSPWAPGTMGSLVSLPICYLFSLLPWYLSLMIILSMLPFSAWISSEAENMLQTKDPSQVVIDEILGMMICFFAIPFSGYTASIGFICFRFFDILKPYPIRFIDQTVPGGWGIVLDDVIAGIYAHIILRLILFLLF